MTASLNLDLECEIESLSRQRDVLQRIEDYSPKLDFGDIIETHSLVSDEIERLQGRLRASRADIPGEEVSEEEEEEEAPSPLSKNKYRLEHVIEDSGKLRPLVPEDLYVENHKGVRDAFRVLYGMRKNYKGGDGTC